MASAGKKEIIERNENERNERDERVERVEGDERNERVGAYDQSLTIVYSINIFDLGHYVAVSGIRIQ